MAKEAVAAVETEEAIIDRLDRLRYRDPDEAERLSAEAAGRFEEEGKARWAGWARLCAASACLARGDYDGARRYLRVVWSAVGDNPRLRDVRHGLLLRVATVARAEGDSSSSLGLLRTAAVFSRSEKELGTALSMSGRLFREKGQLDEATRAHQQALQCLGSGNRRVRASSHLELTEIYASQGRLELVAANLKATMAAIDPAELSTVGNLLWRCARAAADEGLYLDAEEYGCRARNLLDLPADLALIELDLATWRNRTGRNVDEHLQRVEEVVTVL